MMTTLSFSPAAHAQMAGNFVIWADVPDIAMIRVGDIYYMSSTTMHMSPGLPIMKSGDLVNWELASYAYGTLGDNDALTLHNGKNAYGQGSWASSLRYHIYYLNFCLIWLRPLGKTDDGLKPSIALFELHKKDTSTQVFHIRIEFIIHCVADKVNVSRCNNSGIL
jgi:hypothetical protein